MTNTEPDMTPQSTNLKKKLIALIAAGALVVAAGVATAVVSANAAYAAETEELCTAAVTTGQAAREAADVAVSEADAALEAVESTTLPDKGGKSTPYADRPAVEAVETQPATDDNPETKAVAGRVSGSDHIEAVTVAKDALLAASVSDGCVDRDEVQAIDAGAALLDAERAVLEKNVQELLTDFADFQKDEAARIAAEKEAARIAAEKKAAEEAAAEAARIAAEQAAVEQAAWEAQQRNNQSQNNGWNGGGGGNWNNGGSGGGGIIIAPPDGTYGGGCPEGKICYG